MTDISCRLTAGFFSFFEDASQTGGVRFEEVMAETARRLPQMRPPSPEFLANPKNRISWKYFAVLMEVVDEMLPRGWEVGYLERDLESDSQHLPYVRSMAQFMTNPMFLYKFVNSVVGPSLFGTVIKPSSEQISANQLSITLETQEPHRSSPAFFRITKTGLAILPRLLNLPDAVVQAEVGDRKCTYRITLPASRSLFARIRSRLKLTFSFGQFVQELAAHEQDFRLNYARLEKSEAELREIQKVLEDRVSQRTLDLERANSRLESQIKDIVAKEKENRDLQERLFHLQKVEAIGTLASGISHEMNNILQGLLLSLDLAGRHLGHEDTNPQVSKSVTTAAKFASRGRDVMKQLLKFSRKAQFEPTWISVVPTIQEAVELVRSICPKSIDIREIYPEGDRTLTIYGDRTQIQQVVINLASNAAHSMRLDGGEMVIEVRDLGADCAIRVRDSGAGVPPEIEARIFEPFFTTKPVGEGTGMGLAVVRGIVESHLGHIELARLKSSARGSEFVVTLPLATDVDAYPRLTDDFELAQGGTEMILVVDDEDDLAQVVGDTLECYGYKTLRVNSAEEALQILRNSKKKIDVIVTDDSMPDLTGLELAQTLFAERLGESSTQVFPPVVLMTGADRLEPTLEMTSGAVKAFLRKPLDADELNRVIRSTLDRLN